jgi:hypothetical protein
MSPRFYDFETAQVQDGDYSLRSDVASWMNLAEHAALAGHTLDIEDGPEATDPEQREDQGEILENMYAPGCSSSDQAPLTEEQAEELQRRALTHQSSGMDSQGVASTGDCLRKGRRPGFSAGNVRGS